MHFRALLLSLIFVLVATPSQAKKGILAAGPVQGHTSTDEIRVWMMFRNAESAVVSWEGPDGTPTLRAINLRNKQAWKGYVPLVLTYKGLEPGTEYKISVSVEGDEITGERSLRTLSNETPDEFSFLAGSCAFIGFGLSRLSRPGIGTRIFNSMTKEEVEFMLWMGDNVYYLPGDYNTESGMQRRQTQYHREPNYLKMLMHQPNYAIWDDHDFGPNNSDGTFKLKDTALDMFNQFWANPQREDTLDGNFFQFSWYDVDFFMMDDRYDRVDADSSQILGPEQLNWLKNAVWKSKATFKLICMGGQAVSPVNEHESWAHYDEERSSFFQFLKEEKIEGVMFFSGDRHFTELNKLQLPGQYPIYDLTLSPMTSWVRKKVLKSNEMNNPCRVEGTLTVQHNYGVITIHGPKNDRSLRVVVKDNVGKELWRKEIRRSELSWNDPR